MRREAAYTVGGGDGDGDGGVDHYCVAIHDILDCWNAIVSNCSLQMFPSIIFNSTVILPSMCVHKQ